MSISSVVTLILIAGFVVVMFGVLSNFKNRAESGLDYGTCKASLEANARRVEIGGIDVSGPLVEVECGGYDIIINKDEDAKKVLADLMTVGADVNVRTFSNGNEKIRKQFVSGVWKTVDRGSKKYFESSYLDYKFCLPWAYVSSEDNVKVDGFLEYLLNTKIENKDYTYGNFLSYSDGKVTEGIIDKIDFSNDYVLMFVQTNKGFWSKTLGTLSGGVVGTLAGWVGVVTLGLIPGTQFAATGLAIALFSGGVVSGYAVGASYASYESVVVLMPNNEKEIRNLGCDIKK